MVHPLLLLLCTPALASNFAIKIGKYATECFYEQLTSGDRLEISYETVYSSLEKEYEIDFIISNPDKSILHQVDKHRDAAFGFFAGSTGKHEMCIINKNSYADKTISFSFVGPDDQVQLVAPVDASEEEKTLSAVMQTLSNDMRFMKDELAYLNRRVSRHKSTSTSTYSRVFWWSLIQMCILMGVAAFQISYLRGIFEKKRMI